MNEYLVKLTNPKKSATGKGVAPIQAKVDIYKKNKVSYKSNVPITLQINYSGAWEDANTTTTNSYAMAHISYTDTTAPTVSGLTHALIRALVSIGGQSYESNVVRVNYTSPAIQTLIIDAGTGATDRSAFDIFDGYGRDSTIDRML